jgi:hypothetical protein
LLAEGYALGSLVVVLDPPLWTAVRPLWGAVPLHELLAMLVERDERADGRRISVRSP